MFKGTTVHGKEKKTMLVQVCTRPGKGDWDERDNQVAVLGEIKRAKVEWRCKKKKDQKRDPR